MVGEKRWKNCNIYTSAVCKFPRGLANERLKGPSLRAENVKPGSESARRLGLCFFARGAAEVRRGDRRMEGEDNGG